MTPGTNFRHMFRKFLPDPLPGSQGNFMPSMSSSKVIGLLLHIWSGSESRKPNIVGWKIKKLLRNFEYSNGSIFKKL